MGPELPKTPEILIVEDNAIIAAHLESILVNFGYPSIEIQASGEGAVELVGRSGTDLVLMDIELAGKMDGLQAAETIRKSYDIPIIYLTAYSDDKRIYQARDTQPYAFLVKPIQPRELRAAVEMALYKHKLDNQLRISEQRYRELAKNIHSGVIIVESIDGEEDFIVRDSNQNVSNSFQLSNTEILNHKLSTIIESNSETWTALTQVIQTGKPVQLKNQYLVGKQNAIWANIQIYPLSSGEIVIVYEDISAQLLAEKALSTSEKHFRSFFESTTVPMIEEDFHLVKLQFDRLAARGITDFNQYFSENPAEVLQMARLVRFLDINQEALQIYGIGQKELLPESIASFFDQDSIPSFQKELIALSSGKKRFDSEFPGQTASGERKIFQIFVSVMPEYEESLSHVLVSILDITAKKQADLAIQKSEERFRSLFETMVQGVIYYDRAGKIISINPAAEKITGLTNQEIQGHPFKFKDIKTYDENGRELDAADFPSSIALDKGISVENITLGIYNAKTKYFRWVNVNSNPQFLPGETEPYQVYSTLEDITDRRFAERRLAESEERLRLITSQSPDFITQMDQNGGIIFSNHLPGGFSHETGTRSTILDWIPARFHGTLKQAIEKTLSVREVSQFETQDIGSDNQVHWYSNRIAPILVSDKIDSLILIGTDITERKKAENAIQQSEKKYRQLFSTMQESFSLAEVVCDHFGKPIDYRYLEVNETFLATTGFRLENIIGHTIKEIDQDIPPLWIERFGNVALTGVPTQFTEKHPGTGFEYQISAFSPRFGQFASIFMDVTEQSQMQEALKNERNLLSRVIETSPTGILVVLETGQFLFTNKCAEEILEIEGDGIESIQQLSGIEVELSNGKSFRTPELFTQIIQSKIGTTLTDDITIAWQDGHWKKLSVNMANLENAPDSPDSAIIIFNDITARFNQSNEIRLLLEEARTKTRELETLADISSTMRLVQSYEELQPILIDRTARVLETDSAILGMIRNQDLLITAGSGPGMDLVGQTIHVEPAALSQIVQSSLPLIESKIDQKYPPDHLFFKVMEGMISSGVVPLRSGEDTIGVIAIGYRRQDESFSGRIRLLFAIADMAGNALARMGSTETLEELVKDRTKDLETLYRITSVINEPIHTNEALQLALTQTMDALNAESGGILLLDEASDQLRLAAQQGFPEELLTRLENQPAGASMEGQVISENQPLILTDISTDPRKILQIGADHSLNFVSVPIRIRGQAIGALSITRDAINPLNLEEITLVSSISDHLGIILDNARLHQKAEQAAVLEERARLARELHDSVTQSLYGATLFADSAQKFAEQGNLAQVSSYLSRLSYVSQQALKEMRLLVYELRSPKLEEEGLVAALDHRLDAVERRAGVKASLEIDEDIVLPSLTNEFLYRITLEALNNILKHAQANQIEITIQSVQKWVVLTIRDDGKGFNMMKVARHGGMGLTTMRERAERLGGSFDIYSKEQVGTIITVKIPVDAG